MLNHQSSKQTLLAYGVLTTVLMLALTLGYSKRLAWAQDTSGAEGSPNVATTEEPEGETGSDEPDATGKAPAPGSSPSPGGKIGGINVFELLAQAGWFFMIPIWMASVGVVTLAIERAIALRHARILPDGLVSGLGKLGGKQGGFDPRQAYRLCQQFPSAASTVIRAMLLKVGRPHSEVEHAVAEASEREANRLYSNVRWLALAAAVAPLWGLLGTVWGMIMAFYKTAELQPGQDKAEVLAAGIYTALVTTLCGLLIAIPSAIVAHYFEARITSLFHQVDELLFNLLPNIERYEGRARFKHAQTGDDAGAAGDGADAAGRAPASIPK